MHGLFDHSLVATTLSWFEWSWSGNFTVIDLIAATTNALNGALLARRPDHFRSWTVVGILLMAFLGGIGGGCTRDVLLAQIPHALTNGAYFVVCLTAGIVGYFVAYKGGQLFREGLFQFMTSFSLPWYAIAGCMAAAKADVPVAGILIIAVIAPTAGRVYIDLCSGVSPKLFVRSEYLVTTAFLTGVVWIIATQLGASAWPAAGIAFAIGYIFRVTALWQGWEEPMAKEPAGVHIHTAGGPTLGRKLSGKSQRELRNLGLVVEPDPRADEPDDTPVTPPAPGGAVS
jgi:uncharacterized membrane protein YeiH